MWKVESTGEDKHLHRFNKGKSQGALMEGEYNRERVTEKLENCKGC